MIDPVILANFTFHFLSVVLFALLNLETGLSCSSIWLDTFVTFSRIDLETPAWNKRKSEVVAPQGQGGSATSGGRGRQRSRSSSGHSVVSRRGRAEGIDRHRLQNLSCPLRGASGRGNGRSRFSITKQRAPSTTDPRQNAQRLTDSSVHLSCTCGWRSCAAWRRRRGWRQSKCRLRKLAGRTMW